MSESIGLWIVEDAEALRRMAERLSYAPAVGVDTESDSMYHFREKVCLLQFSDLTTDYIVDPLKVPDLSPLAPLFANPAQCKIFHGADFDVVSLRRDFSFTFENLFDTMVASQMLGLPKVGLADLIGRYFGEVIDKRYQKHDWSARPLLPEHLEYARGDTHWLLALREILLLKLRAEGKLDHVREECAILAQRAWGGGRDESTAFLGVKHAGTLEHRELRVLRQLHAYRERNAAAMDRPVYKVIPDGVLVDLARAAPRTGDALDNVIPGMPALKRRHRDGLLSAIRAGLEDQTPLPRNRPSASASRKAIPEGLQGKALDRAVAHLKSWRKAQLDADPRLTPASTVSNGVLAQIARYRPTSIEELSAVPEVRRWQVREFGEALLEVLDEIDPPKGNR